MKVFFYSLVALLLAGSLNAQQEVLKDSLAKDTLTVNPKFKFFGITQFTFNQAYFENWVSGGENSLTGLLSVDYNINYFGDKGWVWDN